MRDGLPFSIDEYRDRAGRVRARMRERGVDVLFVTSPANLFYLTAFQSIWYPPRAPVGVVVTADEERLVFCDYERHETLARETAHYDDAVFYRYEDVLDTIAETFRARGWLEGTIGLERWSPAPGAPLLDALGSRLGELGGKIVSGDWVVDRVRLVKSPAEIEFVRRAGAIVDAAFDDLEEHVRPGQTELEIAARLDAVMAEHGGERAAIQTMVSAGPGVWCRTHAPPTRRPVEAGDVMYVDACGVVNRYHADVCRTFSVGRDHPEARAILDVTAQSVEEVRRAVKPGDPLDVAQRVAEEFVFSRFPREQVWWVGGYALGIAMAPNWVGHTYLSNDAFEQFTWEPGYLTNYENVLFDRDAGFTASYMETLLMTETGIEPLSSRPRTLTVAGA
ncbi:MAG TPA: Xaa-Pro peptidase family protein [Gaiellales bacterium]|nr:Xaa-Pro peptidase family protein [Gaiellales bacterium]